ncbi:MAG: IS1595 family transposase [Chitinophagaceae bacterium]|nr:IS1595 family transposase [Chitinophagaceae bacterium]
MNFAFKTINEFNDYFKTEKVCYEFFEQIRWNGSPVCPHCGNAKYYTVKARGKFTDIPSYRCADRTCGLPFTVRSKSIFEGSKVELKKWLQAVYEISTCKNGISSIELATRIGTSQKTAWFINHRLRGMLNETQSTLLTDVVSVDECSIGGKNKNKHADKKVPHSQGRSYKGKTAVFGARGITGEVRTKVIPNVEAATIVPIIEQWIEKGSIMVSDDWNAYRSLKQDYFHVVVNHSEGEYVTGCFSTNGIENFWSLFKRGVIGTHHSISPKHCQKYANEFADRYNKKDFTNIQRFGKLLEKCSIERETYKELTLSKPE